MKLTDLLKGIKCEVFGGKDINISAVTPDSRRVKKNSLFVAVKGLNVDSHEFIDQVIEKGAAVVVGEVKPAADWLGKITYVKVANSRKVLGCLAANWFGNPSRKLAVIGVTGTDGKTTTCNFIYSILNFSGHKTGLVTSINAKIGDKSLDTGFHVTNPEQLELQKILKLMVDAGCEFAAIEVTSHGLDQERVAGVGFKAGLITNVTHEHLDYHKTYDSYLLTKAKLMTISDFVVLNKDDGSYRKLKKMAPADHLIFSIHDNFLDKKTNEHLAQLFPGNYNVMNALGAAVLCRKFSILDENINSGLRAIRKIPGRCEKVGNTRGIKLIVDFAHTPNGLKSVLAVLKASSQGKLVCVFGCAGERDLLKRPLMGEISSKLADVTVLTAEDPRYEDVDRIIAQIKKGVNAKSKVICIPERGEAVWYAINKVAKLGDTVVICGKGHEKSMAYKGIEYPWSDRKAVKLALEGKIFKVNHG